MLLPIFKVILVVGICVAHLINQPGADNIEYNSQNYDRVEASNNNKYERILANKEPVDLSTTVKPRYCRNYQALLNGSDVSTLLKGRNITVGITYKFNLFFMNVSTVTGLPISGYSVDLLNELTNRGGFHVNYILIPSFTGLVADPIWLSNTLSTIDIIADDWFPDTTNSRLRGIGFLSKLFDASIILITRISKAPPKNPIFGFLKPFTNILWSCILGVIVLNGRLTNIQYYSIHHNIIY